MEGIEHFELMVDVAEYLNASGARVLTSEYSYPSFGSWWFSFANKGKSFRVVYDGRDSRLSLETDPVQVKTHGIFITEWSELSTAWALRVSKAELLKLVRELIDQAMQQYGKPP